MSSNSERVGVLAGRLERAVGDDFRVTAFFRGTNDRVVRVAVSRDVGGLGTGVTLDGHCTAEGLADLESRTLCAVRTLGWV